MRMRPRLPRGAVGDEAENRDGGEHDDPRADRQAGDHAERVEFHIAALFLRHADFAACNDGNQMLKKGSKG